MDSFIIGGGEIDIDWLKGILNPATDTIVAADSGCEALFAIGVQPDVIVGDFDSIDPKVKADIDEKWDCRRIELNPIKDDTDVESALNYVLNNTNHGDIYILGGTGTRLDHVLGNISLLGAGFEHNRKIYLMDSHNKVYMIKNRVIIEKSKQHGKYVSVFAQTTEVKGLTMRGFKYPLNDYDLKGFNTLCVSNEILAPEAYIYIDEGILIVVESRD